MANIIEIHDLDLPELAPYTRMTEAQLRSRRDPAQAMFIAEGHVVAGYALAGGCAPVSLLIERRHIEGKAADLIARCGDTPVYTGSRELLSELTGFAFIRGVLGAFRRPPERSMEEICANARRIAVLEGIVDPTNVGAIFRCAAALNMDGLLLSPTCCDPLNRRAVRVSMGTVFQLPWARIGGDASQWPHPGMESLQAMGFKTAAMALTDDSVSIDDPRLLQEEKLAVVLGTEGDGLASATISACDYAVRIPMSHGVDSLNVAAAGAVAFWELGKMR